MSDPEALTDRELDREISHLIRRLQKFQIERERRGRSLETARGSFTEARNRRNKNCDNQVFVPGDVVEVTNHRNSQFGTRGVVNNISRGNRFVYFTTSSGVTLSRAPNNLKLVQTAEESGIHRN